VVGLVTNAAQRKAPACGRGFYGAGLKDGTPSSREKLKELLQKIVCIDKTAMHSGFSFKCGWME
jgi:hypothetical protein